MQPPLSSPAFCTATFAFASIRTTDASIISSRRNDSDRHVENGVSDAKEAAQRVSPYSRNRQMTYSVDDVESLSVEAIADERFSCSPACPAAPPLR